MNRMLSSSGHVLTAKRTEYIKADCRTCPAPGTLGTKTGTSGKLSGKLADLDSNQDKQNQNLLCYRYTIGQ